MTLQPVRFRFDAAILFSDILVVPHALGQKVRFVEGKGPQLDPIVDSARFRAARVGNRSSRCLLRSMKRCAALKHGCRPEVALLGFCGAPWTVASYMIAGGHARPGAGAAFCLSRSRHAFDVLMDGWWKPPSSYLAGQLQAGADAVQIFDTWAGVLAPERVRALVHCADQADRIAGARTGFAHAKDHRFSAWRRHHAARYAGQTGIDALGLDWMVERNSRAKRIQSRLPVQGNLDPLALLAGGVALDRGGSMQCSRRFAGGPFIFNLGHGILPETPIAHVEQMLRRVRQSG